MISSLPFRQCVIELISNSANPTNAVGGSFILSLRSGARQLTPESHQPRWWIVHTQPTTEGQPPLRESHQRSWWIVHIWPMERNGRGYGAERRSSLRNPTNAVGGLFILSLRSGAAGAHSANPTNAVGGLFILS